MNWPWQASGPVTIFFPVCASTCTLRLAVIIILLFSALFVAFTSAFASGAPLRANVLWITSEDHGPQTGCYGDSYAVTPNVDKLAARGMTYLHAWSCAPVCAPARTTLIS